MNLFHIGTILIEAGLAMLIYVLFRNQKDLREEMKRQIKEEEDEK